jgi:hypothetical protein
MQIEVASELVELGRDDDGEIIIGERFAVRVTAASGRRWEHEQDWTAGDFFLEIDEEGEPIYRRIAREDAEGAAQRLADAVRAWTGAGRKLDASRWAEIQPAYGSRAYEAAETEIVAAERRRDQERV